MVERKIQVSGYKPDDAKRRRMPKHLTKDGWYKDVAMIGYSGAITQEQWDGIFGKPEAVAQTDEEESECRVVYY